MYWGRPVKIDTALYPISTQRNLAVAPDDISMPYVGKLHIDQPKVTQHVQG